MDYVEFTLSDHWASAVINSDYSGLSDEEERQLDAFLQAVAAERGAGHWDGWAEEDSQGFDRDEITGLRGDCSRARYHFQKG